jgi:hypothetical protein
MYLYKTEGLGQFPEPIAAESDRVVKAIRRLPEGRTCPVDPTKHEQRIREQLGKQGFKWFEVEPALRLLRKEWGLPARPIVGSPSNPQASISAIDRGEEERIRIHTARVLEEEFRKAARSDDIKGMEKAAKQFKELMDRYPSPKPGKPMPGRGQMQKHRDEFQRMLWEIENRKLPTTRQRLRK